MKTYTLSGSDLSATQQPHTLEVPFVFGTAPVATNLVSTGPHIVPLTKMMVATWSAFAHRGDPSNTLLPAWPRYSAEGSRTMLLSLESKVASNPDGERRKALDGLPLFEYSMPVNYKNA